MQEYVKSDAVLVKKTKEEAFKVTDQMKELVLDFEVINEETIKVGISGSRVQARQVIAELVSNGAIKTYNDRYAELYPAPKSERLNL